MTTDQSIEAVKLPDQNQYEQCLRFATGFVKSARNTFTSEDMKDAYAARNLPEPKEPRVWGAVIRELNKSGLLIHVGYTVYKKKEGHSRPCSIWRAAIQHDQLLGVLIGGKQSKLF
jgi:hypothetical protein